MLEINKKLYVCIMNHKSGTLDYIDDPGDDVSLKQHLIDLGYDLDYISYCCTYHTKDEIFNTEEDDKEYAYMYIINYADEDIIELKVEINSESYKEYVEFPYAFARNNYENYNGSCKILQSDSKINIKQLKI